MNSINLLPSEVLWKVFSYCDIQTILHSVPFVCKRWCSISRQLPMAGYVDLKIFDDEQCQKYEYKFPKACKLTPAFKYLAFNQNDNQNENEKSNGVENKNTSKGKNERKNKVNSKNENMKDMNREGKRNEENEKEKSKSLENISIGQKNITSKDSRNCICQNEESRSINELKKGKSGGIVLTRARSFPTSSIKKGFSVPSCGTSIKKKMLGLCNEKSNDYNGCTNNNINNGEDVCGICKSNSNSCECKENSNCCGNHISNNCNTIKTNSSSSYSCSSVKKIDCTDNNYTETRNKKNRYKSCCCNCSNCIDVCTTNTNKNCNSNSIALNTLASKVNSKIQKKQSPVIGISTIFASSSINPTPIVNNVKSHNNKYKNINSKSNNNNKNSEEQYEDIDSNIKFYTYCFKNFINDQRTELPIAFNICIVVPLSYIFDDNYNLWYHPVDNYLSKWKMSVKQFGFHFIVNSIEISIRSNYNNQNSNLNSHIYDNSENNISHPLSRISLPPSIVNDLQSVTNKKISLKSKQWNNNYKSTTSRSLPPTSTTATSTATAASSCLNLNSSIPYTSLITPSSSLLKKLSMASTTVTTTNTNTTTTTQLKNNKNISKSNILVTMELLNLLLGKQKFYPKMLKVDNVEWTMDMLNLIPKSLNYLELSFVGIPNVELVKDGVSYLSSFIKNISILSCTIIRPRSHIKPRYYHMPQYFNKKNDICV